MFVCWSLKGGSGTTVVAAALSIVLARSSPTLLVDLCGDQPAALGLPEPSGPGIGDWCSSPTAGTEALLQLAVPVTDRLRLLPCGDLDGLASLHDRAPATERWQQAAGALVADGSTVVVDAGIGPPHPALLDGARSLLVTRSCYLSLRRAAALDHVADGVVLLVEPGRAVGEEQVVRHLRCPLAASLPVDPAVYRAVDAGLLATRLPLSLAKPLERLR